MSAWQNVPFPELPTTVGEAGSILLHNGRIRLAAVGAAIAANSPWLSRAGEQIGLVVLAMAAAGIAVGIALLTAPTLPEARTPTARTTPAGTSKPSTPRGRPRRPQPAERRQPRPTEDGPDGPLDWLGERGLVELLGIATASGTALGIVVAAPGWRVRSRQGVARLGPYRREKPRDPVEAEFLRSIGTPDRLIGPTR